jgi:protein tyrosine phosphatase (PTP) superfamily phosphohydrolase (DUF442 family)
VGSPASLRGQNAEPTANPPGTQAQHVSTRDPDWAVLIEKEHNLHRVTPTFYRSAQIDKSMVTRLKELGVVTVVNLRESDSDAKILQDSGITTVHVPMHTWNIENGEVIAALRAIRKAEGSGSVLLHCQHGSDRTGLITAMYRILYQGWSRNQAIDELRHGGYGFHTEWENIPHYLHRVNLVKIKDAVEAEVTTR